MDEIPLMSSGSEHAARWQKKDAFNPEDYWGE